MNVLVTGSNGFVGRNLCLALEQRKDVTLFRYDIGNTAAELDGALAVADVVFHLAGVNRPEDPGEFQTGNADFTRQICDKLLALNRTPRIVLSSSSQAALDNPYGISKRQAEEVVEAYAEECASRLTNHKSQLATHNSLIYRLPNVFGKWCRNIAHDLPIQINDPKAEMTLVYIDDVVEAFMRALDGKPTQDGEFCAVPIVHRIKLGAIAEMLYAFRNSRTDLLVPDQADGFSRKLYATFLSYLPADQFSYPLKMNVDERGSFTEFLKSPDRGQVSVNISKPGIVKGNHWHHTKNEKFLVVSGRGVIRFRKVGEGDRRKDAVTQRGDVIEYFVSEEKLEVVDIPPGYTHNIENLGDGDMVTVMWANEAFDPDRPDTYFEEV